ncbi:MAG TPA: hypothetical protein PK926_15370 [Spirochaetota bacterium]|nr:hypothetical protein [Spirochaetota bacterium]HPI90340.1 hypothetical protein [Spirochaetota bacterium]HPR49429.1 hypothetical protein [Spirochaetota bacterium]
MKKTTSIYPELPQWYRYAFIITTAMLLFSGLGQMPLYKRYFIADVPGFSWTGDYFFLNHLHYFSAALMAFLIPVGFFKNYFRSYIENNESRPAAYAFIIMFAAFFAADIAKIIAAGYGAGYPREMIFTISLMNILLTFLFVITVPLLWASKKILITVEAKEGNTDSSGKYGAPQ